MSEIRRVWVDYEVCIDWDAENWAGDHDFSGDKNITSDVRALSWRRGKQREDGNAPAATLEIQIKPAVYVDDEAGIKVMKYSPFSGERPGNLLRPWLPVRVRAIGIEGVPFEEKDIIPIYYGYISSIRVNPHPSILSATFYCTDGTDLLARQIITQNPAARQTMSDGEAVNLILNAAGWNLNRRSIDERGGDDLLAYPSCHPY